MAVPGLAAGAYAATQRLAAVGPAAPMSGDTKFSDALGQVLDQVGSAGQHAEAQMAKAVQGKADMVDVVTAVAESESALETLVAVRDKVIAAYEEIMRMPV